MIKGAWLDGYYTSRPFLRADGTLFFFRKGALLAARDLSIDGRLVLCSPSDKIYSTKVVAFAYEQHPATTSARLVRVDF